MPCVPSQMPSPTLRTTLRPGIPVPACAWYLRPEPSPLPPGCASCAQTGYMKCRSCGGGGTAVPLLATVKRCGGMQGPCNCWNVFTFFQQLDETIPAGSTRSNPGERLKPVPVWSGRVRETDSHTVMCGCRVCAKGPLVAAWFVFCGVSCACVLVVWCAAGSVVHPCCISIGVYKPGTGSLCPRNWPV